MNLAALFGDDEHTASENAYVRAMKCRKWVIFSAAAFYIVHDGRFTPKAFSVIVGSVNMPAWIWVNLTTAGLIYAFVQYVLLDFQLLTQYGKIIEQRFGLREFQRLQLDTTQLEQIEREIQRINPRRKSNASPGVTFLTADATIDEATFKTLELRADQLREAIRSTKITERPNSLYIIAEGGIDLMRLCSPWLAAAVAMTAL